MVGLDIDVTALPSIPGIEVDSREAGVLANQVPDTMVCHKRILAVKVREPTRLPKCELLDPAAKINVLQEAAKRSTPYIDTALRNSTTLHCADKVLAEVSGGSMHINVGLRHSVSIILQRTFAQS